MKSRARAGPRGRIVISSTATPSQFGARSARGARDTRPHRRVPRATAKRCEHGLYRRLPARSAPAVAPISSRAMRGAMYRSVHEQLFTLRSDCLLYPAHDYRGLTVTSVGRGDAFQSPSRRRRSAEEDFVGYMANLNLPHPRQIAVAVPANLHCGEPEHAGDAELGSAGLGGSDLYVRGHLGNLPPALEEALPLRAADRRARGGSGIQRTTRSHPYGARLLPLKTASWPARAAALDRERRPLVAVCRSGARSGAGGGAVAEGRFHAGLANLAGGMLRWRAEGCPVEGGQGTRINTTPRSLRSLPPRGRSEFLGAALRN